MIKHWDKEFPVLRKTKFKNDKMDDQEIYYFESEKEPIAIGLEEIQRTLEGANGEFTNNTEDFFYEIDINIKFVNDMNIDDNLKEKICFIDLPGFGTNNAFEQNKVYLASAIGLAISNFLLFLSHIITIIKIYKNKDNVDEVLGEQSCIHIFAQLIFSCLFFCLLHRFNLANSTFLILSNLIGIILTLEWLCLYFYFYHNDNLFFAIFHMLLPICFVVIILSLLL